MRRYTTAFFTLSLLALAPTTSRTEVLAEFDAASSGKGTTPDLAQPAWEQKGSPMTNSGTALVQDTTGSYPQTEYGNYVSPQFADVMLPKAGQYGIEFKIRPLTNIVDGGGSVFANLMVAWGDSERSFRVSIQKSSSDADPGSVGALTIKGDYREKVVGDIDWAEPHTIYIGYRGDYDEFDFYVDGQLAKTISASALAGPVEPAFTGKVAFGDFTSGQTEPLNKDTKAEWYSVKLFDKAAPPAADQGKGSPKSSQEQSPKNPVAGQALIPFSTLSPMQQLAIRQMVSPPPLGERENPYSTPMYFPMWKVMDNAGSVMCGSSPDGNFHPEWQDALIRDWAELGMTKLHLSLAPRLNGTGDRTYQISDLDRAGMTELALLARKYKMKVGLRIDIPMDGNGYWPANPRNPENELKPYKKWVQDVLKIFGKDTCYVVLGDEIDASRKHRADGRGWTSEDFSELVREMAATIHASSPTALVSTPSYGTGSWREALDLVQNGFDKVGDAIAINIEDASVVCDYAKQLREARKTKQMAFLSNGVGYISSNAPRNPAKDTSYYKYNDSDQAGLIAQSMYLCWKAGLKTAPYYIALRNIDYKGEMRPMWYGFFGFMDLIIDQQDRASTRHYPGWYSFQTVASTFYDVNAFKEADYTIGSSSKKTAYIGAHERRDGRELLIVLWGSNGTTNVTLNTGKFGFPVKIDLLNKDKWTDVEAVRNGAETTLLNIEMQGTRYPIIIRMIPAQGV